jgi:endogenous inhibitor of DNA gyrase (YacG/DUF329 family)
MAEVMIKCPETGKLVPTGFSMDKASFESSSLKNNTLSDCPACGKNHVWSKEDAVLKED